MYIYLKVGSNDMNLVVKAICPCKYSYECRLFIGIAAFFYIFKIKVYNNEITDDTT